MLTLCTGGFLLLLVDFQLRNNYNENKIDQQQGLQNHNDDDDDGGVDGDDDDDDDDGDVGGHFSNIIVPFG